MSETIESFMENYFTTSRRLRKEREDRK